MDKLGEVEEQLNNVEKKFKQETSLATLIIQKLIKVIVFLFIWASETPGPHPSMALRTPGCPHG